jgi:hypothetical protein
MSDTAIRDLERVGKDAPAGSLERYRWRLALVRAGRGDEAGLEKADSVDVTLRCNCFVGGKVERKAGEVLKAVLVDQPWADAWEVISVHARGTWRAFLDEIRLYEPRRPA